MTTVLVVAAHPDDEILGCGGAMAKWVAGGSRVHVVIMAEGITSRDPRRDVSARQSHLTDLRGCAMKANAELGVSSIELLGFPDNRMDSGDLLDVTKAVEQRVDRLRPEIVVTHHPGDVNVDHRVIYDAVVTACRPQPGHCVRQFLMFEVPSSTEWQTPVRQPPFLPNVFVDITSTLTAKLSALGMYAGEMREWPHARSVRAVEHLARWRGATVGCEAAEAFALGRWVT